MYAWWWIVVLLILNCFLSAFSKERKIEVDTTFGTFIGLADDRVLFNRQTKGCLKFLGIPFALPPTDDRRFSRPEPEVPIVTKYDATFFRPHCPQSEISNPYIKYLNTSEDCLYLNIFVPGESIKNGSKFPVMIWIYGGIFAYGGADFYSGDILSAFNDVIVVTFNYRINVFGFLDDGSGAFGNNGLHDQKLAINWVHTHIRSFGGNPDQISLFGESAGGVSVVYQVFHEENRGKIKRVIAQSGSPLASFAFQSSPSTLFDDFSSRLQCELETSLEKLNCLRNKSASEIVSKLKPLDLFLPSTDGEFLKGDPKSIFKEDNADSRDIIKSFIEVDFMTGINNKDGGSLVLNYWSSFAKFMPLEAGIQRSMFETIGVPILLGRTLNNPNKAVTSAVVHQYTDWVDPKDPQKNRDNLVDLSTDLFFLVPAVRIADIHAKSGKANTFLYQFAHKPWVMKKPLWLDGALHAWEIPYVFGLTESLKIPAGIDPNAEIERPQEEVQLSLAMMKYWTNFARNG